MISKLNISNKDIKLSKLGLGCMRMSATKNPDKKESISTIHAALDLGINFLNTGDFYGKDGHNELLIGEAIKNYNRDKIFLSVKYGRFENFNKGLIDVGPKNVKNYIKASLKRLGVDYIDLYQPARIDTGIPIEETIGAIADLVKEGYVKHIGLSEVTEDILRKANAVHPISLLEMEYSIKNNDIESNILPAARELGIGIVAFGILGFKTLFDTPNDSLVKMMNSLAKEKNCTVAQLAHAWIYSKGSDIMPLIGARTTAQLEESIQSANIEFSESDILNIENSKKESKIIGKNMPKLIIKNGKVL